MHPNSFPPMIRPVNPRKDLSAIADLIELCFADTLDQSGRDYIRQLRQVAKGSAYLWMGHPANSIYAPRQGFVWEEQGTIVGNLSIFPFQTRNGTQYLIANVAVHPEYRRRGIARLLTERALFEIRQRGGRYAWLNVREDNQPAYHLYRQLHFSEKLRRTSWQYLPSSNSQSQESPNASSSIQSAIQIRRRVASDWQFHKQWLLSTYPPDYNWHLDFQLDWFAPGFFSWLRSIFNEYRLQHLSLFQNQHLIGVATLQSNQHGGLHLWIACNPAWENESFQTFLQYFFRTQKVKTKVSLDYPAGRAVQPLRDFGFMPLQTLIWMQRPLSSSPTGAI